MLEIKNLTKKYNEVPVLQIEELNFSAGETVGIVGNNGAGKTTLLSCILDLIQPSSGNITLEGKDVSKTDEWKAYTHAFLDESFLLDYLYPEEYFEFIANINHLNTTDIQNFTQQFQVFFNDEILAKKKLIRDLSKGNQKKVGIIGALIGNPKIVIFDEPFTNLDPSTQIELKNITQRLSAENPNRLTLISSHDLAHVVEISTRIILLEKGIIIKNVEKTASTFDELQEYFASRIQ